MLGQRKEHSPTYLRDINDARIGSLYSHDFTIALARLSQAILISHEGDDIPTTTGVGVLHEMTSSESVLPVTLTLDRSERRDDKDDAVGHFAVTESGMGSAGSYLELLVHLYDSRGRLEIALREAINNAALSGDRFLHVTLRKEPTDAAQYLAQLKAKKYTARTPLRSCLVISQTQLAAPSWSYRWTD